MVMFIFIVCGENDVLVVESVIYSVFDRGIIVFLDVDNGDIYMVVVIDVVIMGDVFVLVGIDVFDFIFFDVVD